MKASFARVAVLTSRTPGPVQPETTLEKLARNPLKFLLLAVLVALAWFACDHYREKPPFELSFWFWHAPFALTPRETKTLQDLEVKQIFVRAGTFSSDGTNVVLVLPQLYGKGSDAFDVHLVFNADSGVIRHFEEFDLPTLTEQISERIVRQVRAAKDKRVKVIGVQLDFDCPTRLLPHYAELIHRMKPKLEKGWRDLTRRNQKPDRPHLQISVTGLMSWLGSRGLRALSKEVDFIVPQAYEGITGRTVNTMRPVADLETFKNDIHKADDLACRYYVGLPAYGHAFLFDDKGQLVGTYRNLRPQDALRHLSFQFQDACPANRLGEPAASNAEATGEEILRLKAVRPAPDGRGAGYTLAYTIPSPQLVIQALQSAREEQSDRCRGAILYRFPEEDDSLTVPMESLVKAIRGQETGPDLKITVDTEMNSFGVIEKNAADTPIDVFLMVQNTGDEATFVSPDAVTLEITLDVPGVQDVRLRDFDRVSYGPDEERPDRASVIRLQKGALAPGEKARVGPIRLLTSNPKHITIAWKARASNGLDVVSGVAQDLALKPKDKN